MIEGMPGLHYNQETDQSLAKPQTISGTALIPATISMCILRSPEILMHFRGLSHTRQPAPVHFFEGKAPSCTILT
jgi:hypothetical protein